MYIIRQSALSLQFWRVAHVEPAPIYWRYALGDAREIVAYKDDGTVYWVQLGEGLTDGILGADETCHHVSEFPDIERARRSAELQWAHYKIMVQHFGIDGAEMRIGRLPSSDRTSAPSDYLS